MSNNPYTPLKVDESVTFFKRRNILTIVLLPNVVAVPVVEVAGGPRMLNHVQPQILILFRIQADFLTGSLLIIRHVHKTHELITRSDDENDAEDDDDDEDDEPRVAVVDGERRHDGWQGEVSPRGHSIEINSTW
jgi:hypothetical protein